MSQKVRELYEQFPYPLRDPQQEKDRLLMPPLDTLSRVNHYCFGGIKDFDGAFRALVAGGGTGDSMIWLAEQLRAVGGKVTYLEPSSASTKVARHAPKPAVFQMLPLFNKPFRTLPNPNRNRSTTSIVQVFCITSKIRNKVCAIWVRCSRLMVRWGSWFMANMAVLPSPNGAK